MPATRDFPHSLNGFGGEGKERRGILLYGKNNEEKVESIKPVKLKTKSTIL